MAMQSAALALALLAALSLGATVEERFDQWALEHGKVYTAEERTYRLGVFADNVRRIDELNAQNEGAQFGLTVFADLTKEEIRQGYMNPLPALPTESTRSSKRWVFPYRVPMSKRYPVGYNQSYPAAFDWRTTSPARVGPIKDQTLQKCGSCFTFGANTLLEADYVRQTGTYVSLAEQQLVDCDRTCYNPWAQRDCNSGCHGGYAEQSIRYAMKNGMMPTTAYNYTGAWTQECRYDAKAVVARFTRDFVFLPNGYEGLIQAALYNEGPVGVAIYADGLEFYTGGVFSSAWCGSDPTQLNHAVAVVGWGTDAKAGKYWVIRNSWGAKWGEGGYMRLAMGKNLCGLAWRAIYMSDEHLNDTVAVDPQPEVLVTIADTNILNLTIVNAPSSLSVKAYLNRWWAVPRSGSVFTKTYQISVLAGLASKPSGSTQISFPLQLVDTATTVVVKSWKVTIDVARNTTTATDVTEDADTRRFEVRLASHLSLFANDYYLEPFNASVRPGTMLYVQVQADNCVLKLSPRDVRLVGKDWSVSLLSRLTVETDQWAGLVKCGYRFHVPVVLPFGSFVEDRRTVQLVVSSNVDANTATRNVEQAVVVEDAVAELTLAATGDKATGAGSLPSIAAGLIASSLLLLL
eukprot:m51a1_g10509 putative cysteine proteinase rd19a (632) ;mRNA; f:179219-181295